MSGSAEPPEGKEADIRRRSRCRRSERRDDGQVLVRKAAHQRRPWSDPYHLILNLNWPRFFVLLSAFFLAVNLVFAAIYWAIPGSIEHADGSFLDAFFFSIETLATVGYGEMFPGATAGHVVSSLEILVGLMSLAVVTGLMFARFSKPTARVLFSDKAVVRDFDGQRVLMLRVANERQNRMVEPTATLGLVRIEKTADGEDYYRLHDLALAQRRNLIFALTWTLIHRIDAASPLHGWNKEALAAARIRIIASIVGHDETIAAEVHALHEYSADDLYFDHRFVDVIANSANGGRIIDLSRFNDVVPFPASRSARSRS